MCTMHSQTHQSDVQVKRNKRRSGKNNKINENKAARVRIKQKKKLKKDE